MSSRQRIDVQAIDPKATRSVLGLESYLRDSGLDPGLYELIKVRASQINGCAFCLDMHNRDARERGEGQRRLDVLSAWREAPELFTDQERAALAFTEEVTRVDKTGVSDTVWQEMAKNFTDAGMVQVLLAICTINVWNRIAISTHMALPD